MSGPNTSPKELVFVPHPDEETDVRSGLEEAKRDDVLSPHETEGYLRALLGDDVSPK